jgi:hypothetical protein
VSKHGNGFIRGLAHPVRAIREPFGTAGLIVAMVALIAAVGGSAYAATKLNGTQKKEVEKIAKKFAGKPGSNGANGAAGANGAPGSKGDAGAAGAPGTSATTTTFTGVKGSCTEGGIEVKSGSPAVNVCNGKKGDPAEFPSTLPSGKTEKGTWAIGTGASTSVSSETGISFPIPLAASGGAGSAAAFNAAKTKEIEEGTVDPSGCTGSVANPTAPQGKLCVYTAFEGREKAQGNYQARISDGNELVNRYGVSGAILFGPFLEGEPATPAFVEAFGSWAVTAP